MWEDFTQFKEERDWLKDFSKTVWVETYSTLKPPGVTQETGV
jgi:hypothetical protein